MKFVIFKTGVLLILLCPPVIEAQNTIKDLLAKVEAEPNDPQAKNDLATAYVEQADKLYAEGKQKTAFESYKKAIKIAPNHPRASVKYWELKDKNLADTIAVQADPDEEEITPPVKNKKNKKKKKKRKIKSRKGKHSPPIIYAQAVELKALETRVFAKLEKLEEQNVKNIQRLEQMIYHMKSSLPLRNDPPLLYILITIGIMVGFISLGIHTYLLITKKLRNNDKQSLSHPVSDNAEPYHTPPVSPLEALSHDLKLQILNTAESEWRGKRLSGRTLESILGQLSTDREADISEKADSLRKKLMLGESIPLPPNKFDNLIPVSPVNVEFFRVLPMSVLSAVGQLVDVKTGRPGHHRQTADLAGQIARELNYPPEETELIISAALVHDIGMLELEQDFFTKMDIYDFAQLDYLRTHTEKGDTFMRMKDLPVLIREIIKQHHERYDGSGYPLSLAGKGINRAALVVGCAETFTALTNHRPYRSTLTQEAAMYLMTVSEADKFPQDLLSALKRAVKFERRQQAAA